MKHFSLKRVLMLTLLATFIAINPLFADGTFNYKVVFNGVTYDEGIAYTYTDITSDDGVEGVKISSAQWITTSYTLYKSNYGQLEIIIPSTINEKPVVEISLSSTSSINLFSPNGYNVESSFWVRSLLRAIVK